ncbi:ubiquitin carboxyl-terminal hydrolase isozyme L3-like isoform X2 [Macrosteles quadrilineatus]|uniref:ubiquitin carboxyl-terminal hydrolase isozyme L3-like isoform X2 n=1 Tax=Macrosteles quadrilineatus TaxID=74068 RepID=UPI0023E1BFAB|nr:ubiquitin carboxyl-terminal hydrolase isozyme L3-like isoform X2 [Macrosteles quadrilineatus]
MTYWLPLESNPDFLYNLGVPKKWQIVDVYGLDPDLLAVVPQPVLALLLLFPISEKYEQYCAAQDAQIKEKGQTLSPEVFYMKQFVHNACGTVALVHSVANNTDKIQLEDGVLKKFIDDGKSLTPEQRGELLQNNEGVSSAHQSLALEGQSEAPDPSEPVNFHFIAFVCKDGQLYELDGRRSFPINHGASSPDTLLEDGVRVVREYMSRDPDDIRFTVTALTGGAE